MFSDWAARWKLKKRLKKARESLKGFEAGVNELKLLEEEMTKSLPELAEDNIAINMGLCLTFFVGCEVQNSKQMELLDRIISVEARKDYRLIKQFEIELNRITDDLRDLEGQISDSLGRLKNDTRRLKREAKYRVWAKKLEIVVNHIYILWHTGIAEMDSFLRDLRKIEEQ